MKLDIKQKLIGFSCCLVLLVGGAIAFYSVYEGRGQVLATFEEQSRGMAQFLADGLVQDIYFKNIAALKDRIKVSLEHPSVNFVYVFDSAGNLLHSGEKANPSKISGEAGYLPSESL